MPFTWMLHPHRRQASGVRRRPSLVRSPSPPFQSQLRPSCEPLLISMASYEPWTTTQPPMLHQCAANAGRQWSEDTLHPHRQNTTRRALPWAPKCTTRCALVLRTFTSHASPWVPSSLIVELPLCPQRPHGPARPPEHCLRRRLKQCWRWPSRQGHVLSQFQWRSNSAASSSAAKRSAEGTLHTCQEVQ